ncbi:MAG: tetratricopeptide repeat protein [Chitinophagaceae bacterium]|nr:MAG: tetratricopeptide repeat protein [Chitinophagaceae bacterium]
MKKSAVVLFFSIALSLGASAQTVPEGVSHLYAERNASAKSTFEKILAANPNNIDAVYWLGQTHLENNQIAEARNVYQKLLSANGNAPLVVAGMGHVLLAEGKTADARQQFETAITLSKNKDANVLNAIGRANVEVREGDVAYALSKLQQASQLAPNNGDIWINLGNAYRRKGEGGEAVKAYMKAQTSMPAVALYRQARVYETQRNWDIVSEYLNRAIAADARFAPAYLRQYNYNVFYKNDYNAAEQWAQKYVAVADPSVQNEVFKGQTAYLQKNYDQAIQIGNRIIEQSGKEPVSPGVYRMMAYSYLDGKKDTATARRYVDMLFNNTKVDQLVAKDRTLKATIYSKEDPNQVVAIYMDALEGDTTLGNRIKILQEAIDWAKTNNRKVSEADLRLALHRINPNASPAGLFQIGLPYYQGGAFEKADSAFQAYSRAFPDSVYGYLWSARALGSIDSTGKQGLAIPQYEQLLRVASTDKVRFKSYGVEASGMLANYYVNEKGDREKGIEYLNRGLEFDPGNQSFTTAIERLSKKPAAPKSGSAQGSKPKAKSGK